MLNDSTVERVSPPPKPREVPKAYMGKVIFEKPGPTKEIIKVAQPPRRSRQVSSMDQKIEQLTKIIEDNTAQTKQLVNQLEAVTAMLLESVKSRQLELNNRKALQILSQPQQPAPAAHESNLYPETNFIWLNQSAADISGSLENEKGNSDLFNTAWSDQW